MQVAFDAERRELQHADELRSRQVAERRAAAMAGSRAQEEARRVELEGRQAAAEELLRQKEELRQLEMQIKVRAGMDPCSVGLYMCDRLAASLV